MIGTWLPIWNLASYGFAQILLSAPFVITGLNLDTRYTYLNQTNKIPTNMRDMRHHFSIATCQLYFGNFHLSLVAGETCSLPCTYDEPSFRVKFWGWCYPGNIPALLLDIPGWSFQKHCMSGVNNRDRNIGNIWITSEGEF